MCHHEPMVTFGAYLLTGDPVWMRSSLRQYYDLLDDLVVMIPRGGLGWNGTRLPVDACLEAVRDIDHRHIARFLEGEWVDKAAPRKAQTLQRQMGVQALQGSVDWVLQIDNDELLLSPKLLTDTARGACTEVVAIEWPMRVLYRRAREGFLAVSGYRGEPVYEYPGPIAVRPTVTLEDARRVATASGDILRMAVRGDESSLQLRQNAKLNERRSYTLSHQDVILHNSWARDPRSVRQKTRASGHAAGWRTTVYYYWRWWPSTFTWSAMRDFHPFARGLWPRLTPLQVDPVHLDPLDQSRSASHSNPQAGS